MNTCAWTGVLAPAAVVGVTVASLTGTDRWGLVAATGVGAGVLLWRGWGGGHAEACALPSMPPDPGGDPPHQPIA